MFEYFLFKFYKTNRDQIKDNFKIIYLFNEKKKSPIDPNMLPITEYQIITFYWKYA